MNDQMNVSVKLNVFEWHLLLRELEHLARIANYDSKYCRELYLKIGNQLSGEQCEGDIN